MKKMYIVILSCCLLVAGAAAVQAAETFPLGKFNVAVKVCSLDLADDSAGTMTFIGLEGYGSIAPNLYLGGEVGQANQKDELSRWGFQFGREVTFVPVEVNLKGVVEVARNVSLGFGGGISYNSVHFKAKDRGGLYGPDSGFIIQDLSEWLVGAQVFMEVNVTLGRVFIGLNGKLQLVSEADPVAYLDLGTLSYDDYSNWRAGGQIGMRF